MADWISVKDRLPKKNEVVVCVCESKCGCGRTFSTGLQSDGFWFLPREIGTVSFPNDYVVTHWMPLPPPPEHTPTHELTHECDSLTHGCVGWEATP